MEELTTCIILMLVVIAPFAIARAIAQGKHHYYIWKRHAEQVRSYYWE